MSPNTSIGASGSRVLFGSPFDADDVLLLLEFLCGSLGGNESIICRIKCGSEDSMRICFNHNAIFQFPIGSSDNFVVDNVVDKFNQIIRMVKWSQRNEHVRGIKE